MITLLTIREKIRNFYQQFQRGIDPIFRFFMNFILFTALYAMFPYSDIFGSMIIIAGISFVCMWLPLGAVLFLSVLYTCIQLFSTVPEISLVYLLLFLVAYLIYIRLEIQTCLPFLFVPVAFFFGIPYVVPILVGILIGPAGIIPTAFGVFLYFFSIHVNDIVALLNSTSEGQVEAYRYLIEQTFYDKQMLLMLLAFSVVIGVIWTYHRMSRPDAWNQSIIIGGVVGMILFFGVGYILEVELEIVRIILGFILSVFIGLLVQFFKCIVDHSRVEYVQFEDDEYYYYVKAVPKVSVTQEERDVKRINIRKQVKKNDR